MNPSPEESLADLQNSLSSTEAMLSSWSKRIRWNKRLVVVSTIQVIVAYAAFIYLWGLFVVSYVQYTFLDDDSALDSFIAAIAGLVIWLWVKWSPAQAHRDRRAAKLSLVGSQAFVTTGEQVAERLRAQIAERGAANGR